MLFNSLIFWAFFTIFIVGYWSIRGRMRNAWSLVASYVFYGWWDWRFLALIILLTGINYWFGLEITKEQTLGHPHARRRWIIASVVTSLGILGFFKYYNFFIESTTAFLASIGLTASHSTLEIILPVGISFYTFQAMSYTLDLYRREIEVERSLLRFATFIAFFPQLVAGPIVRAADFLPQLRRDSIFSWSAQVEGACMVAWGMVLKVVVADSLAPVVDARFFAPEAMSALSLIIGVLCYAFQIYGDFAGYSLMAIGFAHMLGYHFNRNFDRPYFASSFSDFWRRWHISLSTWLRDYLYIPLGGNRQGGVRTHGNLMLTMLLGGLWHGAAWTFVAWGGLHGSFLCLQRLWNRCFGAYLVHVPAIILKFTGIFTVFTLVCIAWVFFRAQSFGEAIVVLLRIAAMEDMSFAAVEQKFQVIKALGLIAGLIAVEALSFKIDFWSVARRWPITVGIFLITCALAISVLGNFTGNAFIYFQF
jgi:alginate O-acetyltransferase complex protein AlgI